MYVILSSNTTVVDTTTAIDTITKDYMKKQNKNIAAKISFCLPAAVKADKYMWSQHASRKTITNLLLIVSVQTKSNWKLIIIMISIFNNSE